MMINPGIEELSENGKYLYDKALEAGADITLILKENCDHHPHGLTDPAPLAEWVESLG